MKRLFILVLCLFVSFVSHSQVVIQMEEYGGVYKIPCLVNGAKMKLVFDTGATSVCLSQSIATYLLDNDYLSINDFVGTGKNVVADGRIINHLKLKIRDIEIAGLHLSDVDAVVIEGQEAPLLFGLSAINKLGKVTVQGNNLIIDNATSELSIDELCDKAYKFYQDRLFTRAIECFDQAYAMGDIGQYHLWTYILSCVSTDQFSKALRLLDNLDINFFIVNDINIYSLVANVYRYNELYDTAITYYDKALAFGERISESEDKLSYYEERKGEVYLSNAQYEEASDSFISAIKHRAKYLNLDKTLEQLTLENLGDRKKTYRDDKLDYLLVRTLKCNYLSGGYSESTYFYCLAQMAHNRNKSAISFFNTAGVDYEEYLENQHSVWRNR